VPHRGARSGRCEEDGHRDIAERGRGERHARAGHRAAAHEPVAERADRPREHGVGERLGAEGVRGVQVHEESRHEHRQRTRGRAFGESPDGLPDIGGARLSVRAIKSLLDDLGISYKLSDYGVPREEIPALAKATIGAARLISNNPRKVSEKEVIRLLEGNY